jgi:D-alanyl-D-alanine dipeptidase
MRTAPANALAKVQAELKKKGLTLKVYDAYRPFSVSCRLWRDVPDKHYAANPRKGSRHNKGIAVDLTIAEIQTGKELDMGTGFDNFTDSAHHSFTQLSPKALENRKFLKQIMRKYGFTICPTEWWHYNWPDTEGYEVLDIDFDEMKKVID